MNNRRPQSKPRPRPRGVGLATLALSAAVIALLGWAVASKNKPAETVAADAQAAAVPVAVDAVSMPPAFGALAPWPAPSIRMATPGPAQPDLPAPVFPSVDNLYELPEINPPGAEQHQIDEDPNLPEPAAPEVDLNAGPIVVDAAGVPVEADAGNPPIDLPAPVETAASPEATAQEPPILFTPPSREPAPVEEPIEPTPPLVMGDEPEADEEPLQQELQAPQLVEVDGVVERELEPLILSGDAEADLAGRAPLSDLLIDTPAPDQVSKLVAGDVRDAFSLGRHGALYAARARFIAVLRKVAIAKDAAQGSDRHSLALAAGLRALDEASAFVPRGDALETDLDVATIAASHKTPLFNEDAQTESGRWTPPHEAIARYHRYAQHKLGVVASDDQAASMALHGLGKTYARLAELDEAPLAGRTSLTMYRAAVEAHAGNYLAANELGVGLAKAGRYRAARQALTDAIANGGTSTIYRNLAVVEQNLGRHDLAAAATEQANRLAMAERRAGAFSRGAGVEWVSPDRFSRVGDAFNRQGVGRPQQPQVALHRPPQQPPQPPQPPARQTSWFPWRRSGAEPCVQPTPVAVSQTITAPPVRSQTIVR